MVTPVTIANSLLLQWTHPTQFVGDSLLQYEVTLTPLGAEPAIQVKYFLPATKSQLTAQGLQAGEEYQVEIETRVDSGLVQPFYSMNVTIPTTSNPPPPTCPPATIPIASGWLVAGVLLICLVVTLVAALICWRRSGRFVTVCFDEACMYSLFYVQLSHTLTAHTLIIGIYLAVPDTL